MLNASPGIVECVLHNDPSVCSTANQPAFAKLHSVLIMNLLIRKRSVEELGQALTTQIERDVIERLKKPCANLVAGQLSR